MVTDFWPLVKRFKAKTQPQRTISVIVPSFTSYRIRSVATVWAKWPSSASPTSVAQGHAA